MCSGLSLAENKWRRGKKIGLKQNCSSMTNETRIGSWRYQGGGQLDAEDTLDDARIASKSNFETQKK
jgi:hypothetical protein